MTIISSQHYINWDIVEEKMAELNGVEFVTVPCEAIGEIDGTEYAVVVDKHHTMAAAREMGIPVRFDIGDPDDGLTGTDYLDAHYMDGDWYAVETSDFAAEQFDLIW